MVHLRGAIAMVFRQAAAGLCQPSRELPVGEDPTNGVGDRSSVDRDHERVPLGLDQLMDAHGRSERTHGLPQAIASQTERGELSEEAIETHTSAAR